MRKHCVPGSFFSPKEPGYEASHAHAQILICGLAHRIVLTLHELSFCFPPRDLMNGANLNEVTTIPRSANTTWQILICCVVLEMNLLLYARLQ